jgi:tight adherence protein C
MTISPRMIITVVAVLGAGALVPLLVALGDRRRSRLDSRLRGLQDRVDPEPDDRPVMSKIARSALPKFGSKLVPENESERTLLQSRLVHAGFYSRQAMGVFLGVKLLLMVGPALVGLIIGLVGLVPVRQGVLIGAFMGITGMIGPGFWLDGKKKKRQTGFRRALPDALDVIVICLEGGLSLTGALRRVATEMKNVHPILASELEIAIREIQLGRTAGESIRNLGQRADLEELRSLASVLVQAERFGAGLIKSLRIHADGLRLRRQQRAEEMAQKAATKILFPTLLCIFPAIFVVVLGPAVIQISATLLNNP